ncbi:MAG: hypothetical protein JWM91_1492, partial [Rhodospirillales bacterium]|nr:hypothetical protein [Rhodospirillales bacterium]
GQDDRHDTGLVRERPTRRKIIVHGTWQVVYVNYLSSNAYSEVISRNAYGWFGRSTMFNPSDLEDNAAEQVLIDTQTRQLLEPSHWGASPVRNYHRNFG